MRTLNRPAFSLVVVLAAVAMVGCRRDPVDPVGEGGAPEIRGPVAIDLVDRFPAARVLSEHSKITFGDSADSARLISGWDRSEIQMGNGRTFTWANAEASELVIDLTSAEARRLEMRCWPFRFPGSPDQTVTLIVNGGRAGIATIRPSRRRIYFDIPEGVLLPGRNLLRFEYGYAGSPKTFKPGSNDRRRLAAGFEELSVHPTEAALETAVERVVVVGSEQILQGPATAVVYDLIGPRNGLLSVEADFDGGFSGTAEVWLRPEEGVAKRLMRFEPGGPAGQAKAADLGDMAGRRFDLVFAVSGGGGEVLWTRPRLHGQAEAPNLPVNVVLIVVDTLRADALGVYGGSARTPRIDQLAREGVVFDRATSHIPITGPSHSSMFTSRLPFQHGVLNNARTLSHDFETVAEVFRESGRRTAGFVSLGVLHHDFGFDQGFDHYGDSFSWDWMKSADEVLSEVMTWLDHSFLDPFFLWVHLSDPHEPYSPPGLEYPRLRVLHDGVEIHQITADGNGEPIHLMIPAGRSRLRLELVDAKEERMFRLPSVRLLGRTFKLEPSTGLLGPIVSDDNARNIVKTRFPAEWTIDNSGRKRGGIIKIHCAEILSLNEVRKRYRLEVEAVDAAIGHLLDQLKARGHTENAIIVIVSDHGEGIGDHGLIGHIEQLYDSLVRVPLIIWSPGRVPEGLRIQESVSLIDLAPTLAELAGVRPPKGAVGRSLVVSWEREAEDIPVVIETHRPEASRDLEGLLWHGHKLIRWSGGGGEVELYDISADPDELVNLAQERPDLVAELSAQLDRILAGGGRSAVEVELTDEERDQLRALGYVH
ncbi:MAG: sulfatase-like hydrolase/transferase, partial [Thermoanaerobaculales bacterium]|nr:sulfatase-like hydrolase/transferase [Thermoanaerobaculales bacterium]